MVKPEWLVIVPYGNNMKLYDRLNNEYWLEGRLSVWATLEENRKLGVRLKGVYEDYISAIAYRNNGKY
jgi:hypothetical protein